MRGTLEIRNARVWTGDPVRPWAESLVIRQGRVEAAPAAGATPRTRGVPGLGLEAIRTIDAAGRVVTPGLLDAHMHLLLGGRSLGELDLSAARSRAGFEQAIARGHAALPTGEWLIGRGWQSENWGGADPDKTWLRAAGDRPACCYRMDLHAVLVNDAVLNRCDLSHEPDGGRVVRDSRGEPTGLMVEAVAWTLVNPLVPEPAVERRRAVLMEAQRHCHALGLTGVGSMEYERDLREVFEPCRDRLTLRCRITLLDRGWPMSLEPGLMFAGDERLAVIGYKAFLDGTLGSRTARMLADYADAPGHRGELLELARNGTLLPWARAVAAAGLSPSMHAIGDEAARRALDVLDQLPREVRGRIEHAQQLDPVDIPRFRGRIASMQPLHKADDGRYVRQRLGESRLGGTFAFRRLLEAGAILAFGSDWPVVSPDPVLGMRAAITGLTLDGAPFAPDQNLTVEETLRAYTLGAAVALGLNEAGRLAPGCLGDCIMFDRDPFSADWVHAPPRVAMTVVGGEVVYDRDRSSS
jgi:hypothetical protein